MGKRGLIPREMPQSTKSLPMMRRTSHGPHCLAAPERVAPDRVSEVTFPIFVHSTSIYHRKTRNQQFHP